VKKSMKLSDIIFSFISYLLLLFFGILLAPFILIFMLMPAQWRYQSRVYNRFVQFVYWLALRCTLLPIAIEGACNIPCEPAIIVANHQSSLDVPLVGLLMHGYPHVWLAKVELFESYLLRFLLRRLAIPIDVSTPNKAMRSLVTALAVIRDKPIHAIIFPEGGRYIDGKVHDFFAGFVMLAKKTGRPVVPVHIFDAYKVYPPGSFIAHRHPIKVVVGKPMRMNEGETDKAFKDRVQVWFVAQT